MCRLDIFGPHSAPTGSSALTRYVSTSGKGSPSHMASSARWTNCSAPFFTLTGFVCSFLASPQNYSKSQSYPPVGYPILLYFKDYLPQLCSFILFQVQPYMGLHGIWHPPPQGCEYIHVTKKMSDLHVVCIATL